MNAQTDLVAWHFAHELRVRWAESDIQGVVFNGHYLTYFDIGITEYLRSVFENDQQKLHAIFNDLYVVKSTVQYQSPAHFDELIEIAVRTAKIGRTSLVFEFEIKRENKTLVSGENVYVHAPDGESTPVPDALREAIERFENR